MKDLNMNKSTDILQFNQDILNKYEPVIGLEVHCQLKTQSKLFCSCSTIFGSQPNVNTCEVCLGYPGVLPVLNSNAVDYAIKMALAINATINPISVFARKQYFYPDLPKGYQITQYDLPYCNNGYIQLSSGKKVNIVRIHLEEDAGKNIHGDYHSYVDLNRAGIPLLEIVSAPDITEIGDAIDYLKQLRAIVRYLDICDGNLEEGSFRCDANISVRLKGTNVLNTRCEIKNLNSFKNIERALKYEMIRQIDMIENGLVLNQQTLLFNPTVGKTYPMREKEETHDYRYFPEPDLNPLYISEQRIQKLRVTLPKLPQDIVYELINKYKLKKEDAYILSQEKALVDYFYGVVQQLPNFKNYTIVANWILTDVLAEINTGQWNIDNPPISIGHFAQLLELIDKQTISTKIAKQVFKKMLTDDKCVSPNEIIIKYDLYQINDAQLIQQTIQKILDEYPIQVREYLSGKHKIFGFFVGQILNRSKGKYNPELVNILLKEILDKQSQIKNE